MARARERADISGRLPFLGRGIDEEVGAAQPELQLPKLRNGPVWPRRDGGVTYAEEAGNSGGAPENLDDGCLVHA